MLLNTDKEYNRWLIEDGHSLLNSGSVESEIVNIYEVHILVGLES